MWKGKKHYFYFAFGLILLISIAYSIYFMYGIIKIKQEFMPDYLPVGLYFPPANKTVAILLYPKHQKMDINAPLALIGDKEQAEKIMDRSLNPKKLIEGREWLEKIMDAYKTALKEAKKRKSLSNCFEDRKIVFLAPQITSKKGYERNIGIDYIENTVCDAHIESKLLKIYFDKLGLTDEFPEFEMGWAGSYYVPPTDKVISILLYAQNHYHSDINNPIVLFGDQKSTETIIGSKVKPKILIGDREWLRKFLDAYRSEIKEYKEKEFRKDADYLKLIKNRRFTPGKMRIVFMTQKNGYQKFINIDSDSIYDYDSNMESHLLKKYFDELGLTKELLSEKPRE